MALQIFLPFVLVALHGTGTFAMPDCPIQHPCNDTHLTDSEVENFCTRHDALMSGRCCSFNSTIIGLDLRYCGIRILNISFPVFSDVEILDLRDNDFDKFASADLIGLLKLDFLYLPQHMSCPGGPNCWDETSILNNMTSCFSQRDPCAALNISCGEPDYAHCKHTGPGSAKCECTPGYFGYKCLNQGDFPVIVFTLGIIIPTIVLSIALWFIQGRDPYKKMQES